VFTAEILSVGDELLIGKTTNTNLTWLSGQLTHLGGIVRRGLTVRDEISEISEALTLILGRKPDAVIISGGLGPTFDDKTLQGIAHNLGLCLRVDRRALDLVKERVGELNPGRLKMAHLPEGSRALRNPKGTAPGVYLTVGKVHLFALPGVPSEMRAIFKNSVVSLLGKELPLGFFYEASLLSSGIPESKMAPIISEGMAQFPEVYIKSHPLGMEKGRPKIILHITSQTNEVAVQEAREMLRARVKRSGGIVASP
jgi:molybdenum cofactor synthesis domain-containing protein